MVDLKKCFDSASTFFASNVHKVSDNDKLKLYGYYKVVTSGPLSGGFWNTITLDPKKKAWRNAGNVSKPIAMAEYCNIIEKLNIGWESSNYEEYLPSTNRPSTLASNKDVPETLLDKMVESIRCGDEDLFFKLATSHPELVNKRDSTGGTPLHWAADSNQNNMIDLFLKLRFYIDAKDDLGQTPLHIAATCENYEAVRELLHNGADLDVSDNDGETPREIIENNDQLKKCCRLFNSYMNV